MLFNRTSFTPQTLRISPIFLSFITMRPIYCVLVITLIHAHLALSGFLPTPKYTVCSSAFSAKLRFDTFTSKHASHYPNSIIEFVLTHRSRLAVSYLSVLACFLQRIHRLAGRFHILNSLVRLFVFNLINQTILQSPRALIGKTSHIHLGISSY